MEGAEREAPVDERGLAQHKGNGQGIIAGGDRISLEEASQPVSVENRIALGEHEMRRNVAYAVIATFALLNLTVFALLTWFDSCDRALIVAGKLEPERRLLSTELLMTIVGATTVQMGAIAYIVATYLFPKPR